MSDIVKRLNGFCVDWDGSELPANAEPMDGIHCDVLLDAATEITRLRSELANANEENKCLSELLTAAIDDYNNARNAALEEASWLVRSRPLPEVTAENVRWRTSVADSIAALKAEGESR